LLSPPQKFLLVNTSKRKIRELEHWREKTGQRGTEASVEERGVFE